MARMTITMVLFFVSGGIGAHCQVDGYDFADQPACKSSYDVCDVPCGNPDFPAFTRRLLSPQIPHDVDGFFRDECLCKLPPCDEPALKKIDRLYSILAWQSFVAANWPTSGDGPADSLRAEGPPAWTNWFGADQLFPTRSSRFTLSGVGFVESPAVDPCASQNKSDHPVWDQSGNEVVYETIFNTDAKEYICVQNPFTRGLHTRNGQIKHTCSGPIDFEWGHFWDTNGTPYTDPKHVGSVILKLAWMALPNGDEGDRFLIDARSGTPRALVAMHIAHKTKSSRPWVWATFEHINALESRNPSQKPLFRDPDCEDCEENVCPEPTEDGVRRTQIKRILDITPSIDSLNAEVRSLLAEAGSVLRHYQLVAVQWSRGTEPNPRPRLASNPLIETYDQEASCTRCHDSRATVTGIQSCDDVDMMQPVERPDEDLLARKPADFVFALQRAPWREDTTSEGLCGQISSQPDGTGE